MSAYYTLVAVVGLSLLMGYAGQISLGHAAFFAIGGYTSAVLTTFDLGAHRGARGGRRCSRGAGVLAVQHQTLRRRGARRSTPGRRALCAVAARGRDRVRARHPGPEAQGHYLAMATLGVRHDRLQHRRSARALLGAADGITGVPPFPLARRARGGRRLGRARRELLRRVGARRARACCSSGTSCSRGSGGRSAPSTAPRTRPPRWASTSARYKLRTFVLSAVLAAVAGVFLTHLNGGDRALRGVDHEVRALRRDRRGRRHGEPVGRARDEPRS